MMCAVLGKELAVLGEGTYGGRLIVSHQEGIADCIGGEDDSELAISFHCALR